MSVIDAIVALGPIVESEFMSLAHLIAGAVSPSDAIAKAKRALEMDGLEKASDAAVNAILAKANGK